MAILKIIKAPVPTPPTETQEKQSDSNQKAELSSFSRYSSVQKMSEQPPKLSKPGESEPTSKSPQDIRDRAITLHNPTTKSTVGKVKTDTHQIGRLATFLKKAKHFKRAIFRAGFISGVLLTHPQAISPTPHRVRVLLVKMGTTFQKLGQFLCTMVTSESYQTELKACFGDNPPMADRDFARTLRKRLDKSGLSQNIQVLEVGEHLGTGSVAEVRKVKVMQDGQVKDVVVKLVKPGVRSEVRADRHLIGLCSKVLGHILPSLINKHVAGAMDDFLAKMEHECDLTDEAKNAEEMADFVDSHPDEFPDVDVCRPLPGGYGPKILIMEEVTGSTLAHSTLADDKKVELRRQAMHCWGSCLDDRGFFHADCHDGNLMVSPDGTKITFIDFGSCGRLSQKQLKACSLFQEGKQAGDPEMLARALVDIGNAELSQDKMKLLAERITEHADSDDMNDFIAMINIGGEMGIHCPGDFVALMKHKCYSKAALRMPVVKSWKESETLNEKYLSEPMMKHFIVNKHWQHNDAELVATATLARDLELAKSMGFHDLESWYGFLNHDLKKITLSDPRAPEVMARILPEELTKGQTPEFIKQSYATCLNARKKLLQRLSITPLTETDQRPETLTPGMPVPPLKVVETDATTALGQHLNDRYQSLCRFLIDHFQSLPFDDPENEQQFWQQISDGMGEDAYNILKSQFKGVPWQKVQDLFLNMQYSISSHHSDS